MSRRLTPSRNRRRPIQLHIPESLDFRLETRSAVSSVGGALAFAVSPAIVRLHASRGGGGGR